MSVNNNAAELTRSHAVYAAKKRAKKTQIQEILFDDDARREYLTGFRKRNLLKKEAKVKSAKERARLEKLEMRKEHRRELAERAAQNVKEVEGALGAIPDIADSGFASQSQSNVEAPEDELEFEDEEQLAVVTVVEDFTAESLMHPAPPPRAPSEDGPPSLEPGAESRGKRREAGGDKKKAKANPAAKAKVGKFRYEPKARRNVERTKQRARHTEKAERAGGKKKRGGKR